jgi:hypothetical protein
MKEEEKSITLKNSQLRWETTESYDIGVDLGFFNNRLGLLIDYYNKLTFDRLYDELRGIETRIESFFYVLFYKHLGHSEIVNHDDPAFVKLVYHLH